MHRAGKWMVAACCLMAARTALAAWPIAPGATLVEVYSEGNFYEGPSWDPLSGRLYFTDLTGITRILRLDAPHSASTWMNNTQGLNGTFLGLGNRLLAAGGNTRQILSMAIGQDGPEDVRVLAFHPQWNPPNDLWQTYRGHIYFTAPDFNTRTTSAVYHVSPFGTVTKVIDEMTLPNGVAVSPDGQTLYVSDSWEKWWRSYPIQPDGSLGPGSVFFNPATPNTNDPDGMTVDELGNLYFTGRGGVWIVSPQGQQIEMISVPEFVTNVTFGGPDGKTLYLACKGRVYTLAMQVRGELWTRYPDPNQAPVVNAGPDRSLFAHQTVSLQGSVSDDGLPVDPGQVTALWTVRTAGNTLQIADPSDPATTAVFQPGTFVLRLTAYDGSQTVWDEVVLTVYRLGDFNHDDQISAHDMNIMIACLGGSDLPVTEPECLDADLDLDADVDLADFAILQRCLGVPALGGGPDCTY